MSLQNFYNKKEGDEVIVWSNDPEYEGFSVLRDYPINCGFVPVKKPDGSNDTKILIKIGFANNKTQYGKVFLSVAVSKFELYLSGRFGYDFENEKDSPSKESVNISNQSAQPIPLQDSSRYSYEIKTGKIYDTQNKKEVLLNELIDDITKLHIETIRGRKSIVLKSKLGLQKYLCEKSVRKVEIFLKWLNKNLFGKDILENKENWGEGLLKPIPHARLTTMYPHTIPFFESNIQISKASVFWISLTIFISHYLIPSKWAPDGISSIATVVLLIFLFDSWLPHIILMIINGFIRFRMWFGSIQFHFD